MLWEKLIEIMTDLGCNAEYCKDCKFSNDIGGCVHRQKEIIADRLIANGVTVQEWISVKDELPKEQGYYRVYHKNSKSISDRFYYKDCPYLFVNVMDDPITYWKPIEQPPKGE